MAHTNETRQTHRAAINKRHSPTATEHSHLRVFVHYSQIAPERQLQTASHRIAINGGNDWFAEQHPAGTHGAFAFRLIDIVKVLVGQRFEIIPGTERSVVSTEHANVSVG